ncbi:hypothetical protein ACJX0J_039167 [Zea mays]
MKILPFSFTGHNIFSQDMDIIVILEFRFSNIKSEIADNLLLEEFVAVRFSDLFPNASGMPYNCHLFYIRIADAFFFGTYFYIASKEDGKRVGAARGKIIFFTITSVYPSSHETKEGKQIY